MIYLKAFMIGGLLCAIAQILIDKTALSPARILTGYVVTGAALSGTGLYEPLVRFAECGATVPLTGFGHCLIKGVRQAVDADGALGILTGGLTGAAAGITAAMVFTVLFSLFASGKPDV